MAKQFPEYISKLDTEVFSGSLWSNADENETRNIDVNLDFLTFRMKRTKLTSNVSSCDFKRQLGIFLCLP